MKVSVLFVCMGNICRSPMAEGVFSDLLFRAALSEKFRVDSAGTTAYHAGEAPDPRAQAEAARRGVPIHHQRSRGLEAEDYENFDYIIAMDFANLRHMQRYCPPEHRHKLHLCLDFAPSAKDREVPDPYYGGKDGFRDVFDMVHAASAGLLEHIRRERFGDDA